MSEGKAKTALPEISSQISVIENLERNSKLVVGEDAFLISADWLSIWKQKSIFSGAEDVPPIDNTKLLDGECVSRFAEEGKNYKILTESEWNQYFSWYGGGPAIKVRVIDHPTAHYPVAVVKYHVYHIYFQSQKAKISSYDLSSISAFKHQIRKHFQIPETTYICPVATFEDRSPSALDDDSAYLFQYSLHDGQTILVDTKPHPKCNQPQLPPASVSVQQAKKGKLGICGLQNLGNTCFFNSALQCLLHTKPLVESILRQDWEHEINESNPLGMKGKLARSFHSLCAQYWSGSSNVISPSDLKHTVGQFAKTFSGWGQQDAHELITFLLDGLHEDLNRCIQKPMIEPITGDGTNDGSAALESWKRHLLRNSSIIVDTFHGLFRSQLLCPICQKMTVVFDPYVSLSLPISKPNTRALRFKFIPYDFRQPSKETTISVHQSLKVEEISAAFSAELKREVSIVVGTKSSYYSSVKWGVLSVQTLSSVEYLAFEIPDPKKFYCLCRVASFGKAISSPFLVEISGEDADEGELKIAIEQKLSCVWNVESGFVHSEDTTRVMKSVRMEKSNAEGKVSLVVEEAPPTKKLLFFNSAYPHRFEKHPIYNMVAQNAVTVRINGQFQAPESGFSLASLMRNVKSSAEPNTEESLGLRQCFNFFRANEVLDDKNQWYCPYCKQFVCAGKKMDIWSAPKILIIQLKRFTAERYSSAKNGAYVEFPEVLDMDEFVEGPQHGSGLKYELYAVSHHMGGMGGGHYTAHAKVDGEWHYFNDSSVSPSHAEEVHRASAYILFYQMIEGE